MGFLRCRPETRAEAWCQSAGTPRLETPARPCSRAVSAAGKALAGADERNSSFIYSVGVPCMSSRRPGRQRSRYSYFDRCGPPGPRVHDPGPQERSRRGRGAVCLRPARECGRPLRTTKGFFQRASICRSRSCLAVETRAYPISMDPLYRYLSCTLRAGRRKENNCGTKNRGVSLFFEGACLIVPLPRN
jgi:hypothetical protein